MAGSKYGNKYVKEVEKDLVAEQPGLGLALIGILIAVLIGLVVKATLAPERVRVHIDQALAKIPADIQKKVQIHVGETSISLARGIFPDLSLVIKDVRISSDEVCWLAPQIEINEIRLPLSWSQLFVGRVDLRTVDADVVDVSLRNTPEDCKSEKTAADLFASTPSRNIAQALTTSTTLAPVSADALGPIRFISMRKFLVHYLPVAFTTFEVDSFNSHIVSKSPLILDLSGKVNLGGDTLVGDYASHASTQLRYDASKGPLWTLSARGDWREGRYDLSAYYSQDLKKYEGSLELKHLPLSQLLPLLAKYRLMENDYNGRQVWLSGKVQTAGMINQWNKNPLHVSDVKMEGDLGEVQTSKIEIHSLKPITFDPVSIDLRGINLNQFLVLLNRSHPSPAMGDLGTFNGVATIENPGHIRIRGDHSGLEFIFSNRGARETQTLSLLSGEAELKNNRWQVKIDRIRPLEGVFDGVIEMQADKDWRDLNVSAKIDEMSFSPNVQTLMTGGGSFGALSGKMKGVFVNGGMKDLEGSLKSDRILVEGMHVEHPRFTFSTQKENYLLDVNAQEVEIDPDSSPGGFVAQLLPLPANSTRYLFRNISGRFQTQHLTDLQWSNFQALIPQGWLHAQGGWSDEGDLFGQILVHGPKAEGKWLIRGDRGSPLLQKAPL
jgi:hypothetical protein